ncbi:MAG: MFS transporter [Acidimicrobiales bacterium]
MATEGIAQTAGGRGRSPLTRLLFVHQVEDYPGAGRRTAYLALAVVATIVLYYTYYTQTGVTPDILRSYHMPFADYVVIVIVSNLIGAFSSLPASRTDRLGRANVIIYGLLIVGLLVWLAVPAAGTTVEFGIVISAIGLVEGAILVATPAMVRDFSPQLGRASAMGFWTVGPVAGSLITSIVANHTLSHFVDWQSQFVISGLSAVGAFILCLVFMKDLSPTIRDQLMVSARDRVLVEARASGIDPSELRAATEHPWRQILRWDLVVSAFGVAVFLLVYYVAAGFFTIYFSVTFKSANGLFLTTTQVNGLNTWFWATDIVALIVLGALSDWLKVRKPLMVIGALGSIGTLIAFLGLATDAHTGYYTIVIVGSILAVFLSCAYSPWMAAYTETVEAKNPALVGTGLALWGWILRLVVGISFIFLPLVITSVSSVVDNQPASTAVCYPQPQAARCISSAEAAAHHVTGQTVAAFIAGHPKSVAFAEQHAALLKVLNAHGAVVAAVSADPSPGNIAAASRALGPENFGLLVKYATDLKTLVQPYTVQLDYLAAHQSQLAALTAGVKRSPSQWQHWFWVDVAGMIVFLPTIWFVGGRWSPRRARQDEAEHERAVAAELAKLSGGAP